MSVTLWHIELSPFSEKARWALDYKRVPHGRRTPMPGLLTKPVALALSRGRWQRMPVLQLDGRTVPDSTAIVAALEEHAPDPPLYPDHEAARVRALTLERHFTEEVAPEVRRVGWHHQLRDPELTANAIFGDRHPGQARLVRTLMPVTRLMLSQDYGVNAEAAVRARERVEAAIARIETELAGGDYLVGDRFSVADLSAASLLTPLIRAPERPFQPTAVAPELDAFASELEARPGGRWVLEMYRRHRGAPALA